MISPLIDDALILEGIAATDKLAAIDEIVAAAVAASRIDESIGEMVRSVCAEREARGSTGIGNGIAVPHVKNEAISSLSVVLAISKDGIEYSSIDGKPVHIVFMILAPAEQSQDHLTLLKWVSGLARKEDFRRFARTANSSEEIRDLLHEMTDE